MCSPYFGTRTAAVAYLVSEAQTVPQRDVLLDDSGLVCSPLMNRGQFRERLSCENKVGKISIACSLALCPYPLFTTRSFIL